MEVVDLSSMVGSAVGSVGGLPSSPSSSVNVNHPEASLLAAAAASAVPDSTNAAAETADGHLVYPDYRSLRTYLDSYLLALAGEIDPSSSTPGASASSLAAIIAQSNPQRGTAQDKMAKLSTQAFLDLAVNVIDEINRRVADDPSVPSLPARPDLDAKKNMARHKLSTLPLPRFKDVQPNGDPPPANNTIPMDILTKIRSGFELLVDEMRQRIHTLEKEKRQMVS
ncbi:component of the polarisome [Cladochytrium tenue]|nr:component of the polarisome [Cladochytrium tenue]